MEVDLTLKRSFQLQSGFIQFQVAFCKGLVLHPLSSEGFYQRIANEIHLVIAFLSQKGV